jgi:hypothetical protein
MSRVLTLACTALAALLVAQPAPADAAAPALRVEVTTAPTRVSTRLGDTFAVASTLRNVGASPLAGLVAHLNVVSLTHGVYVDPEDWSDQRTQYAAPIPPGQSVRLTWKVKAVNGGDFAVYVVALPGRSAAAAGRPLAVSPAVAVHATERRTLDAGGALPVVLLVPGLLALATLGRRRRRRPPARH